MHVRRCGIVSVLVDARSAGRLPLPRLELTRGPAPQPCFQFREDALRVQDALCKRLGKFGLTLEPAKTKLVEFGRFAQQHASRHGRKRPETIYFLGFTLYCTRNLKGNFKVGMRTEKSRLRRSLMSLCDQMRQIRHLAIQEQVDALNVTLRGHYAYYGIAGNIRAPQRVHRFVLGGLLRFGSNILFVDPFFDPYSARYKSTLRECLSIVKAFNPGASCEIHYRYHDNKPSQEEIQREAANLFKGVIPVDMKINVYCWREKNGGADFHDRFLLTEKGGISSGSGFSADGAHQVTNMHLMSFELTQRTLKTFARSATDYELVGPVVRIAGDGSVERL